MEAPGDLDNEEHDTNEGFQKIFASGTNIPDALYMERLEGEAHGDLCNKEHDTNEGFQKILAFGSKFPDALSMVGSVVTRSDYRCSAPNSEHLTKLHLFSSENRSKLFTCVQSPWPCNSIG